MKLYVVTADVYEDGYGSEIKLFGVYSDEEKAKSRKAEIEKEHENTTLTEIEQNSDCEIYLGGYIE